MQYKKPSAIAIPTKVDMDVCLKYAYSPAGVPW